MSTTNAASANKGFGKSIAVNQGRPLTTKGRGGGFFNTLKPIEHAGGEKSNRKIINFEEDDLNDISIIKDSQGQGRFMDEESFN